MKKPTNKKLPDLDPLYVLDKSGKRISVLINIDQFTQFMDEIEDLYLGIQAQDALSKDKNDTISHDDVIKMFDADKV